MSLAILLLVFLALLLVPLFLVIALVIPLVLVLLVFIFIVVVLRTIRYEVPFLTFLFFMNLLKFFTIKASSSSAFSPSLESMESLSMEIGGWCVGVCNFWQASECKLQREQGHWVCGVCLVCLNFSSWHEQGVSWPCSWTLLGLFLASKLAYQTIKGEHKQAAAF